jgi:putative flippase GtrA
VSNNLFLVKFLCTGAFGTVVHYLLLFILVEAINLNAAIASMIGAIAGAVTIYSGNYFYTFNSKKKHSAAIYRFMLMAGIGTGINGLIVASVIYYFEFHYFISQALATAVVFTINFIISKSWVF